MLLICSAILALAISVKPLMKYCTLSCSAEDISARPGPAETTKNASNEQEPQRTEESAPATQAEPPAAGVNSKYDFSDLSHWNLTVSAWESLAQKDYDGVFVYAKKCLEIYEPKAREMAVGMKSFSRPGHEDDFALVNDVATSHYIMGEAYMKLGRSGDAVKEFTYVIETYPYAQCWDPKGWFWKVSEVSRKNIDKINKSNPQQVPGAPQ